MHKYTRDSGYFNKIDTTEKAYIFGFLLADGHNDVKRGRIEIKLKAEDNEHLNKIKVALNYNGPLYYEKKTNSYRLRIIDKKLSKQLETYGMISNKTFNLKFPHFLNHKLISHFIRGYFDGDGTIWRRKRRGKQLVFGICGAVENFLYNIQQILVINCKLNFTRMELPRKDSTFRFVYEGNRQVKKISDYLYKDATIYLDRKYNQFLR